MMLSTVLAWIDAPVSLMTLSVFDGSSHVAVTTAPSHVATLSSVTNVQRPSEFRHGSDPHNANLPAKTLRVPDGVGLALNVRTVDALARSFDKEIAQPRAPPLT
ncbi:MAG: hypothetical protein ACJAQU_001375 [Loktanella salsilacus]|jgi:hypothetical protein